MSHAQCTRAVREFEKVIAHHAKPNHAADIPNLMGVAVPILAAQPHCVDSGRLHRVEKLMESDKRQGLSHSATYALLRMYMNSPGVCIKSTTNANRNN